MHVTINQEDDKTIQIGEKMQSSLNKGKHRKNNYATEISPTNKEVLNLSKDLGNPLKAGLKDNNLNASDINLVATK